MSTSRRSFLASLTVAAVAPGALGRAAASAPPQTVVLWGCTTQAQVTRAALSARQCGRLRNPAWIFYDLCRERYGEAALDRSAFEQLAALCEEPVSATSLSS